MGMTSVSNFGLPAQGRRLTGLGSGMAIQVFQKSSILWQFLEHSEQRQACQFVDYVLPMFCPLEKEGKTNAGFCVCFKGW